MLAVGGFRLEQVLELHPSLKEAGLFDPSNLSRWDEARVTRELNAAGYSRGLLTGMYAERLVATMRSIAVQEIDQTEKTLGFGSSEEVAKLLLPQYGIGPKVLETFLHLRSVRRST